jgi:predicted nucleic-acid-binding protein
MSFPPLAAPHIFTRSGGWAPAPVPALCELVWVLSQGHKIPSVEIAEAIRQRINCGSVMVNRSAVEAGLSALEAGGDFADGVIAHEGGSLGGEIFVSFDKKAVKLLESQGRLVGLLS